MGAFDDQIAWLRKRRAATLEDLRDFQAGEGQFRNDVDITDRLIARARQDISKFDSLIEKYESANANWT